ncbi:uncharacterized protein LOC117282661 [Cryptotermes secundus]|uniref:uncharacterized protein LOC117282661 n=1 Tax=Cryptotermes secundus TaxID=105785 RepID=UPI001454DC19|nr:uncharacterized protein LOC117282661 [Cryptotermes secundus]
MPFFVFKLYVPGSKLAVQYGSRTKVVEDQAISWRISDLFSDELSDVPCEMCSDSDSDSGSGSDRGQQRIVATDSKSDSSSDKNADVERSFSKYKMCCQTTGIVENLRMLTVIY